MTFLQVSAKLCMDSLSRTARHCLHAAITKLNRRIFLASFELNSPQMGSIQFSHYPFILKKFISPGNVRFYLTLALAQLASGVAAANINMVFSTCRRALTSSWRVSCHSDPTLKLSLSLVEVNRTCCKYFFELKTHTRG